MNSYLMRSVVSGLLVLSAVLLALLIPGGAIETRDFSHIPAVTLGVFNAFLTVLGLLSVVIGWFILRRSAWSMWSAMACGVAYFMVYLFDLAKIFPVSPDAMPNALIYVEVLGVLVALPLVGFAMAEALAMRREATAGKDAIGLPRWLVVMLVMAGVGVTVFATRAAMGLG